MKKHFLATTAAMFVTTAITGAQFQEPGDATDANPGQGDEITAQDATGMRTDATASDESEGPGLVQELQDPKQAEDNSGPIIIVIDPRPDAELHDGNADTPGLFQNPRGTEVPAGEPESNPYVDATGDSTSQGGAQSSRYLDATGDAQEPGTKGSLGLFDDATNGRTERSAPNSGPIILVDVTDLHQPVDGAGDDGPNLFQNPRGSEVAAGESDDSNPYIDATGNSTSQDGAQSSRYLDATGDAQEPGTKGSLGLFVNANGNRSEAGTDSPGDERPSLFVEIQRGPLPQPCGTDDSAGSGSAGSVIDATGGGRPVRGGSSGIADTFAETNGRMQRSNDSSDSNGHTETHGDPIGGDAGLTFDPNYMAEADRDGMVDQPEVTGGDPLAPDDGYFEVVVYGRQDASYALMAQFDPMGPMVLVAQGELFDDSDTGTLHVFLPRDESTEIPQVILIPLGS